MPVVTPSASGVAGRPVYVNPKPKFGTPFPSAEGIYPPACQVEMPEIVHPPSNRFTAAFPAWSCRSDRCKKS